MVCGLWYRVFVVCKKEIYGLCLTESVNSESYLTQKLDHTGTNAKGTKQSGTL